MITATKSPVKAAEIQRQLRILNRRLKQEQEERRDAAELAARAQRRDARNSFLSIQHEAEQNIAKLESQIAELKRRFCKV